MTIFSRPMRRWLLRLAAFMLALALPFAALIGFVGFVPETSQQSLLYTLHYKLDLLRDTPGDRILIVGGSASEYGVRCETIQQATGRPTLCAGVTAYLGADFYLNMMDRYAREGDTVILMMEHLLLRGTGVDYTYSGRPAAPTPTPGPWCRPGCGWGRRPAPGSTWPSAGPRAGTRCKVGCAGQAMTTRPARPPTARISARWGM